MRLWLFLYICVVCLYKLFLRLRLRKSAYCFKKVLESALMVLELLPRVELLCSTITGFIVEYFLIRCVERDEGGEELM